MEHVTNSYKKQKYAEAMAYMLANPTVSFDAVGKKFDIDFMTASRLWSKATNAPRKSGRKKGVSPARKNPSLKAPRPINCRTCGQLLPEVTQ